MAKRDFFCGFISPRRDFLDFCSIRTDVGKAVSGMGWSGPNFIHGDPNYNRAASAKCRWSRAVCGLSPSASAALRGRRRLLLLRERASQRTALLPGARAHCISVPRSAAQKRGRVSDTTAAAPPSSVMNCNLQPSSARYRCGSFIF
jgi:hypothetical protein